MSANKGKPDDLQEKRKYLTDELFLIRNWFNDYCDKVPTECTALQMDQHFRRRLQCINKKLCEANKQLSSDPKQPNCKKYRNSLRELLQSVVSKRANLKNGNLETKALKRMQKIEYASLQEKIDNILKQLKVTQDLLEVKKPRKVEDNVRPKVEVIQPPLEQKSHLDLRVTKNLDPLSISNVASLTRQSNRIDARVQSTSTGILEVDEPPQCHRSSQNDDQAQYPLRQGLGIAEDPVTKSDTVEDDSQVLHQQVDNRTNESSQPSAPLEHDGIGVPKSKVTLLREAILKLKDTSPAANDKTLESTKFLSFRRSDVSKDKHDGIGGQQGRVEQAEDGASSKAEVTKASKSVQTDDEMRRHDKCTQTIHPEGSQSGPKLDSFHEVRILWRHGHRDRLYVEQSTSGGQDLREIVDGNQTCQDNESIENHGFPISTEERPKVVVSRQFYEGNEETCIQFRLKDRKQVDVDQMPQIVGEKDGHQQRTSKSQSLNEQTREENLQGCINVRVGQDSRHKRPHDEEHSAERAKRISFSFSEPTYI